MDASFLDDKYFIDSEVYNCPFCNRRNVRYQATDKGKFDWSTEQETKYFTVKCSSCGYTSFHLTNDLELAYVGVSHYAIHLPEDENGEAVGEIDDYIIYSRPTSFSTIDDAIPKSIRELLFEAEQCLQFNLLTGGSASLRKAIYKLVKHEKVIITNETTSYADYEKSIKALAQKFPAVNPDLFNTLSQISGIASNKVHEDDWEGWKPEVLRFLIELVKSILEEMYVIPKVRAQRRKQLQEYQQKINPPKEKIN